MKRKNIELMVNEEDVSVILTNVLNSILSRQNKIRSEALKTLKEEFSENTKAEVLNCLRKIIKNNIRTSDEINLLAPLVLSLNNEPGDIDSVYHEIMGQFRSSAETEILEDLPDLEEDSLGVDSGSE